MDSAPVGWREDVIRLLRQDAVSLNDAYRRARISKQRVHQICAREPGFNAELASATEVMKERLSHRRWERKHRRNLARAQRRRVELDDCREIIKMHDGVVVNAVHDLPIAQSTLYRRAQTYPEWAEMLKSFT